MFVRLTACRVLLITVKWWRYAGRRDQGKVPCLISLACWIWTIRARCYSGQAHQHCNLHPQTPMEAAKFRRSQLGFIFQRFNLVPVMTALENVAYPLHLNGFSKQEQQRMAQQMLEKVGLGGLASSSTGSSIGRSAATGGDCPCAGTSAKFNHS